MRELLIKIERGSNFCGEDDLCDADDCGDPAVLAVQGDAPACIFFCSGHAKLLAAQLADRGFGFLKRQELDGRMNRPGSAIPLLESVKLSISNLPKVRGRKYMYRAELFDWNTQVGIGITLKSGGETYRQGVIVQDESSIPKAIEVLDQWADDKIASLAA